MLVINEEKWRVLTCTSVNPELGGMPCPGRGARAGAIRLPKSQPDGLTAPSPEAFDDARGPRNGCPIRRQEACSSQKQLDRESNPHAWAKIPGQKPLLHTNCKRNEVATAKI